MKALFSITQLRLWLKACAPKLADLQAFADLQVRHIAGHSLNSLLNSRGLAQVTIRIAITKINRIQVDATQRKTATPNKKPRPINGVGF